MSITTLQLCRMVLLILLLISLLVWNCGDRASKHSDPGQGTDVGSSMNSLEFQPGEANTLVADSAVVLEELTIIGEEPVRFNEWGRNPFQPYPEKPKRKVTATKYRSKNVNQKPRLTGIVWKGDNRKALINGHLLSPGEKIDGLKVSFIGETIVILKKGNQSYILKLKEGH